MSGATLPCVRWVDEAWRCLASDGMATCNDAFIRWAVDVNDAQRCLVTDGLDKQWAASPCIRWRHRPTTRGTAVRGISRDDNVRCCLCQMVGAVRMMNDTQRCLAFNGRTTNGKRRRTTNDDVALLASTNNTRHRLAFGALDGHEQCVTLHCIEMGWWHWCWWHRTQRPSSWWISSHSKHISGMVHVQQVTGAVPVIACCDATHLHGLSAWALHAKIQCLLCCQPSICSALFHCFRHFVCIGECAVVCSSCSFHSATCGDSLARIVCQSVGVLSRN